MGIENTIRGLQNKVRQSKLYGRIENSALGWWLNSIDESDQKGQPKYITLLRRSRQYATRLVSAGLIFGAVGTAYNLELIDLSFGVDSVGEVAEKKVVPDVLEWDPVLRLERRVTKYITIVDAPYGSGEFREKCVFYDKELFDRVKVGTTIMLEMPEIAILNVGPTTGYLTFSGPVHCKVK